MRMQPRSGALGALRGLIPCSRTELLPSSSSVLQKCVEIMLQSQLACCKFGEKPIVWQSKRSTGQFLEVTVRGDDGNVLTHSSSFAKNRLVLAELPVAVDHP